MESTALRRQRPPNIGSYITRSRFRPFPTGRVRGKLLPFRSDNTVFILPRNLNKFSTNGAESSPAPFQVISTLIQSVWKAVGHSRQDSELGKADEKRFEGIGQP